MDEEYLRFLAQEDADLGEVNPYGFFPQDFRYPRNTLTQNIPIAIAQNPAMVDYGIMGTDQAAMFQDDAGLPAIDTSYGVANEPDVEREEKNKGLANLFQTLLGFAVPGAGLLMNLGRGGLQGIQSLNQRIQQSEFGRSPTLAAYFKNRRDRKAREAAAARGAEKQKMAALQQMTTNMAYGGGDRQGGFGAGAGTFRESEPTATEGSF